MIQEYRRVKDTTPECSKQQVSQFKRNKRNREKRLNTDLFQVIKQKNKHTIAQLE